MQHYNGAQWNLHAKENLKWFLLLKEGLSLWFFKYLTEMTTISISVVVLASLIFLDSLDSPLITLTFLLELSNLARFFSASLIARKSRKFKITREMQGIQWTNRMRNLKNTKSSFLI